MHEHVLSGSIHMTPLSRTSRPGSYASSSCVPQLEAEINEQQIIFAQQGVMIHVLDTENDKLHDRNHDLNAAMLNMADNSKSVQRLVQELEVKLRQAQASSGRGRVKMAREDCEQGYVLTKMLRVRC